MAERLNLAAAMICGRTGLNADEARPSSWADEEVRTGERRSRDGPGTLAEASIAPVSRCWVGEIERFGMSPVDHSGVLSRWDLVSVQRHDSALMVQRPPLNPPMSAVPPSARASGSGRPSSPACADTWKQDQSLSLGWKTLLPVTRI